MPRRSQSERIDLLCEAMTEIADKQRQVFIALGEQYFPLARECEELVKSLQILGNIDFFHEVQRKLANGNQIS